MPRITLNPTSAQAQRMIDALDREGFTGTSSEKLTEVTRRCARFLSAWVRGSEQDDREKIARSSSEPMEIL